MSERPTHKRLLFLIKRPFTDELGGKGWFGRLARPQPHRVRELALTLPGWPGWPRPLRVVFLSDFHTGSHTGDVARMAAIVAEAQGFKPDLALFGGDYVNLQYVGGGRVPPRVIAAILGRLSAPCGRIAVLGNHDVTYGAAEVNEALRGEGITVLDDERMTVRFEDKAITIVGVKDARFAGPAVRPLLRSLPRDEPAIVLTHDPAWFAEVTSPSHLTLAGHTHGGQIRLPLVGALVNQSRAPLRWSYGHVVENGRHLYVTSGLGTSVVPVRIGIPPEYVVLDLNGV